jgi:hypothetical protein
LAVWLAALVLMELCAMAPASAAQVSFTRAWGWGVTDGAQQFETCTTTCLTGRYGGSAGQFYFPSGVAVDGSGDVFVADTQNGRVDEFSSGGAFIRAWGWGVADGQSKLETCTTACQSGIDGGGAGQLHGPTGIAVDGSGDVFVADTSNDRVDEFSSTGAFIKAWGWDVADGNDRFETCTTACRAGLPGGSAGQLYAPVGAAVDRSGDVFVADFDNERVDEFSSAGAFIQAWGWGVADGQSQFERCTTTCQTGIRGSGAGQLDGPFGVTVDGSGDVFVGDTTGDRLDEFSPDGAFIQAIGSHGAGPGQLYGPHGVAVDGSGDVLVADSFNRRLAEFSPSGAFIKAWGWGVADGNHRFETCTTTCQAGILDDAGGGLIIDPQGVVVDGSGNVFVADYINMRVDEFGTGSPSQNVVTVSLAGTGAGSVTSIPTGISCPGTCSHGYARGTMVTLSATPATGSAFAGWSGAGCSGTGTCTVTISSDQAVTATFEVIPLWAVPTPAQCGGASRSAVFALFAVARSGAQCSETTVDESLFAEEAAREDGYWCHSKPNLPGLPVTESSPIAFICHLWGLIATSDYDAWASGSAAGSQLPKPRGSRAQVQNAPPATSFAAVFQLQTFAVPTLGKCLRLRRASCHRLRTAEVKYLDALANVASVSEAVAVTANRFGGAKDAGDRYAEWLQGVAARKYLPLQASAIRGLQQASRRLAARLRRDHLNITLTAKQVARGRQQLSRLDGISKSIVTRLERDGLITSRNDLKRIIAALLKKQPRAHATTLAQLLDT